MAASDQERLNCEQATTPPAQCDCTCYGALHGAGGMRGGRTAIAPGSLADPHAYQALPADDPHHIKSDLDRAIAETLAREHAKHRSRAVPPLVVLRLRRFKNKRVSLGPCPRCLGERGTEAVRSDKKLVPVDEPVYPYEIEFYDDPDTGVEPVREWMRELESYLRRAIGVALREVLQRQGIEVCSGEWGKQLGEGLFEFRVRHAADEIIARFTKNTPRLEPDAGKIALRVFYHAHGDKLLLLLGGYDKEAHPSEKRQDAEIATARRRLTEYRHRSRA